MLEGRLREQSRQREYRGIKGDNDLVLALPSAKD